MSRRLVWLLGGGLLLSAAAILLWTQMRSKYSVTERLEMHGTDVQTRVAPQFTRAGVAYPPHHVALVAFKDARLLEVYARDDESAPWRKVNAYPILGMSGNLGPKLREGDRQVPEGVYRAEFLNANSGFHLSIRLDYPNAFDRARGAADGRDSLGSDIMIHGSTSSIGCLAMGDEAAEDLFVIAALAGKENVRIVVAPTDFRKDGTMPEVQGPGWLAELYQQIRVALLEFPD